MVIETTRNGQEQAANEITGAARPVSRQDGLHAQRTTATQEDTMSKASDRKSESADALNRLRELVKPGDTVYTTCAHVSRSGMSRLINAHAIIDGAPQWLSGYIARAGLFPLDKREALRVGGCGMDMGFHVVYNMSAELYRGGFGCIGERCPSNDHSNGDRDYTPHSDDTPRTSEEVGTDIPAKRAFRHWHRDGGYAIRQRWM